MSAITCCVCAVYQPLGTGTRTVILPPIPTNVVCQVLWWGWWVVGIFPFNLFRCTFQICPISDLQKVLIYKKYSRAETKPEPGNEVCEMRNPETCTLRPIFSTRKPEDALDGNLITRLGKPLSRITRTKEGLKVPAPTLATVRLNWFAAAY